MKKYMGTRKDAFQIPLILLVYLIMPLVFGIIVITADPTNQYISWGLTFALCVAVLVVGIVSIAKLWDEMFSYGNFKEDCVEIKPLFKKKYILNYRKCVDVGIGCFMAPELRFSDLGKRQDYIYFSYSNIRKDRYDLNCLRSSNTFVKVGYSKELYDYLLEVLPPEQKFLIKQSYREMQIKFDFPQKHWYVSKQD